MSLPVVKLGDVADFIRGITFKPDDVVSPDAEGAVVCMRTKNVQAMLDCDDLLAIPSQFVKRKDQFLQEGDVLVSSANSWNLVGKCCWIPALPWRAAFGGFVSVLRGDSERVDRRYLYWWFASGRIQALLRSFGQKTTNISNLNIDRCLQLELPLPPLTEQRRIAAILDKADALRAKRREVLAQFDRLAQSIFLEMFGDPATNPKGWPTRQLSTLVAEGDSINYGVVQPGDDSEVGVPLVRVGDLQGGGVSHLSLKKIDPQIEGAYKRSRLKGDEILVSCVGSIGIVALTTEAENGFNVARAVARIRLGDAVKREYVAEHLRSESVQNYFRQELRTVSQPTLNIKQIAETLVMLPPKELQTEFVHKVSAVKALTFSQLQATEKTANLFASLQRRAFQGEL